MKRHPLDSEKTLSNDATDKGSNLKTNSWLMQPSLNSVRMGRRPRRTVSKADTQKAAGTWKDTQGQPSEKWKSNPGRGTSSHQPEWPLFAYQKMFKYKILERWLRKGIRRPPLYARWWQECRLVQPSWKKKIVQAVDYSSQHSTQSRSVCRRGQGRMAKWMNIG